MDSNVKRVNLVCRNKIILREKVNTNNFLFTRYNAHWEQNFKSIQGVVKYAAPLFVLLFEYAVFYYRSPISCIIAP